MGEHKDNLERMPTSKSSLANGVVAASSEYNEYLRLNEVFVGDKLKVLVRKIEHAKM